MSKITENVNEAPGNNSKDETWQMTVENFDEENEIASRVQSSCSCKLQSLVDASIESIVKKPSIICRICLTNDEECDRLLTPCFCRGTQGFVHRHCLECWLSQSGLSHCELCLFHFPTANHLRYGMLESMRIWFSYANHLALLQTDVILCLLMSMITFGMVAIAVTGMYYLSDSKIYTGHVSRYWTETFVGVFMGIVLFGFVLNTIVVVKSNIVPWYRWWRRSKEVELIIRDNPNQCA